MSRTGVVIAAALVVALVPGMARAQWRGADAESTVTRPDSAAVSPLTRYLGGLADSTDRRFGAIAAPADTSGFATVLATADWDSLSRPRHRRRLEWAPWWRFDRTTGHVVGASGSLGSSLRGLQLAGSLGYAASSYEWFGRGELRRRWGGRASGSEARWLASAGAGRAIGLLDSDREPSFLMAFWAAMNGSDWRSYLRRDGASATLERETPTLRLRFGARAELESPRTVATEWNLFGSPLKYDDNIAARLARVNELSALATWRLPWPQWWVEGEARQASDLGRGDMTYTRTRGAVAGKLGLGRWATLVPQAMLGRLEGDLAPQDAFYLGGTYSLRSIPADARTGQRKVFGRLELFGGRDLLALAHIPHGPLLATYGAVQIASGAVWGDDPLGGPSYGGHAWPPREAWLSEAGFSLMFRPGFPSPDGFLRFDYAHGIGADPGRSRWTMQFSLPFDQLAPPLER